MIYKTLVWFFGIFDIFSQIDSIGYLIKGTYSGIFIIKIWVAMLSDVNCFKLTLPFVDTNNESNFNTVVFLQNSRQPILPY